VYRRQTDIEGFLLGMQTPFQRQILYRFSNKCICLDATRGANQQGFYLVTLLVVDDRGKGFPVTWLLTKREDEASLSIFFAALKHQNLRLNCVSF